MPSLISLTFDDGFRCQFERARPILNSHRISATFFLIANQQPTHENRHNEWWKIDWCDTDIAMLKEMAQKGHEIGSHTVTHDGTKMPMQPGFEASESKRRIEGWVGIPISSFCYPYYGSYVYLSAAAKNAGYGQARMGAQNSYYPLSATLGFDVDCRQVSKNDNVKEWIKPDHWHVLTFHGIGDERTGWEPVPVDRFAAMVAELAEFRESGVVEIVTFGEGAKRFKRGVP
jgi:peptidoglycan/xylan/chitin deacetylase (PgdA/CDA1 family)